MIKPDKDDIEVQRNSEFIPIGMLSMMVSGMYIRMGGLNK